MIGGYLTRTMPTGVTDVIGPATSSSPAGIFEIALIKLVGLRVLHDARHLGDEVLIIAGAAQEVEADFHPGADAAAGDDAAGVDHPRTADPALRRDFGEAV